MQQVQPFALKRFHLLIRLRLAYCLMVLFFSNELNATEPYQPSKRYAHSTVLIDEQLYLWGGWQPGLPKVHNSAKKRELTSYVDVFHRKIGV